MAITATRTPEVITVVADGAENVDIAAADLPHFLQAVTLYTAASAKVTLKINGATASWAANTAGTHVFPKPIYVTALNVALSAAGEVYLVLA